MECQRINWERMELTGEVNKLKINILRITETKRKGKGEEVIGD